MRPDGVSKARWLIGLEKEKEYNKEREDIKQRLNERRVTWGKLLDLLQGEVTFDNSKRILDVGAEATSIFLALREGGKYAVDPLFDYLFARHPFLKDVKEYKDVHFISSPIEDMTPNNRFDIIFTLASLEHVGNIQPVVDNIDKLLAPSGFLIVFVECYKDMAVRNVMSFFDLYPYHPHHFVAEDIIRLFSHYNLKKRERMSGIHEDCPFRKKRAVPKIYRIDKLIAMLWRLQYEWGKRRNIYFATKLFLCLGLAFSIALLRRIENPIYPFTEPNVFVFQKQ